LQHLREKQVHERWASVVRLCLKVALLREKVTAPAPAGAVEPLGAWGGVIDWCTTGSRWLQESRRRGIGDGDEGALVAGNKRGVVDGDTSVNFEGGAELGRIQRRWFFGMRRPLPTG
jgi:hypothetical protein